jgi:hypothetical protein
MRLIGAIAYASRPGCPQTITGPPYAAGQARSMPLRAEDQAPGFAESGATFVP